MHAAVLPWLRRANSSAITCKSASALPNRCVGNYYYMLASYVSSAASPQSDAHTHGRGRFAAWYSVVRNQKEIWVQSVIET
jgi:hypothetical protein